MGGQPLEHAGREPLEHAGNVHIPGEENEMFTTSQPSTTEAEEDAINAVFVHNLGKSGTPAKSKIRSYWFNVEVTVHTCYCDISFVTKEAG